MNHYMKETGLKNIKMICPYETAENAKLAKNKVTRLIQECSLIGRKETKDVQISRRYIMF